MLNVNVTIHTPTITEAGRVIEPTTLNVKSNGSMSIDRSDFRARDNMDRYDILRLNESLILRAIDETDYQNNTATAQSKSGDKRVSVEILGTV